MRQEIAAAVARGATLEEVEEQLIECQPLSRDARDALWLFAWATVERSQVHAWARAWRG